MGRGPMFGATQRESHILVDGHLWIKRIALKNHRYVPISRLQAVDIPSSDPDPTPVWGNNPGNQVERRSFPGACRAKNGDELLIRDVQGNIFNRSAFSVPFSQPMKLNACHFLLPFDRAKRESPNQMLLNYQC